MKTNYMILAGLMMFILVSCSTKSYTYRDAQLANKNVISTQTVVDTKIDFSKKIQSTSSSRKTQKEAVEEAHYLAIQQNNIDFVVDPIIEITSDSFNNHVAKITGWGGVFVNPKSKIEAINDLKKVDTTDIKKFDMIYRNNVEVEVKKNSFLNNSKSKSSKWLVLIPIVGLLFLL